MIRVHLILLLLAAALFGCQTTSQEPLISEPEPVLPEQLYPLLDQAQRLYEVDTLTAAPGEPSAHSLYRQVLSLDPNNTEALRGVEKIAERFVALALEAADEWRLASARSMLARARLIDANHPSIAPTQAQIDLLSDANREVKNFDSENMQSSDNQAALKRMGRTAKLFDCRTRIRASSDADGRWMYQQMNSAPGEARVRASMEIGRPTQVSLICFNSP